MIQIKNLVKVYNKGKTNEFCALKGIDLSIDEGEMVAIIGKSGAGKSTLLHILAAIDSYDKGSYLVDGVSVGDLKEKDRARFRNQKIGIVMQDYALIDEYIEKDLSLFKRLNLDKKEIHCILAAGEMIPETYYHMKETKKDFEGFLPDKIFTKKKMLKLMGNIHAQSLLPTLLLIILLLFQTVIQLIRRLPAVDPPFAVFIPAKQIYQHGGTLFSVFRHAIATGNPGKRISVCCIIVHIGAGRKRNTCYFSLIVLIVLNLSL